MKKSTLLSMALLALTATSCQNDEQEPQLVRNNTLQAVVADAPASRAAFDAKGKFFWTKGDQIAVNVAGGAKSFKTMDLVGGAGTPEATFSCQLSEGEQFDQWAVYPASMNPTIKGNDILYTLPSTYTLTDPVDTAFPENFNADAQSFNSPMLGKVNTVDGKIDFKNLCGVACFHLNGPLFPTLRFRLQLEASAPIAGTFKVSTLSNDMQVISNTNVAQETNPSKSVKVDFVASANDGTVYIPIPVGTYSKLHCKLYVYQSNGTLGDVKGERTIYNVESTANSLINFRLPLYDRFLLSDTFGYERIEEKPWDCNEIIYIDFTVHRTDYSSDAPLSGTWKCIKKVNDEIVPMGTDEITEVNSSYQSANYTLSFAVQPNNSNNPKLIIYEFLDAKTDDFLGQVVINQAGKP